jgi:hypothetical protein
VASLRPAGWLIDGGIALAVFAAVGILTIFDAASSKRGAVAAIIVVGAVLLLIAVIVASISTLAVAVGSLGLAAVLSIFGHDLNLARSVTISVGLLVTWELGSLAISERSATTFRSAARWRRYLDIGAAVGLGAIVAAVVGVAGSAGRGDGLVLFGLGAAAVAIGAATWGRLRIGRSS